MFPARRLSRLITHTSSDPLHLLHSTCSLPETPHLLPSPCSFPHPTPPPNPTPISSLSPLPVSSAPPSLFRPVTTTSETPSLPASEWPFHIGPELVDLQYIARPCSASLLPTSLSPLALLSPVPPPEAGRTQLPSVLRRGCFPVILLATLD